MTYVKNDPKLHKSQQKVIEFYKPYFLIFVKGGDIMASMRRTIARAIKRDSSTWIKGLKYGDSNRKTRRAKKHEKKKK